jgi:hypothetical protein
VNTENVRVVSEQTQASYIKMMITKYFACDPTVVGVQLFLLVDETFRNGRDATGKYMGGGWQSGLVTAGGDGVSSQKLAYGASAPLFAAGRSACSGQMISWSPSKSGAAANGGAKGGSAKPGAKPPVSKKHKKPKKKTTKH